MITLCYTQYDMADTRYWSVWAQYLQRWGLNGPAALFLDAVGPLKVILAQLVYVGQPLLGQPEAGDKWQAFGLMLENQEESKRFADFLRKEDPR